jgi:hypothetical protein
LGWDRAGRLLGKGDGSLENIGDFSKMGKNGLAGKSGVGILLAGCDFFTKAWREGRVKLHEKLVNKGD